jgi:sigma-B regulation protein RsbU (phosphoserine phosphatase)
MASLQTSLRILMPDHAGPAEVLQRLNHLFCHNIQLTKFVTLFLARFEPDTYHLAYASAGHNPPLLFRPGNNGRGSVTWLMPTGPAIGLVEAFQIAEESISLLPGDTLLLYTDGVTEAMNPQQEEFGTDRLAAFLQQEAHLPANILIRELRAHLRAFTQGQPLADDTTIVVGKVA